MWKVKTLGLDVEYEVEEVEEEEEEVVEGIQNLLYFPSSMRIP